MKLVIDVRRDTEAAVWYAVSRGKEGLATESESLDGLRARILAVLSDLLDVPDVRGTRRRACGSRCVHGVGSDRSRITLCPVVENFAKPLKKLLSAAGRELPRQGKGDHEIWHNPGTGEIASLW